jgi:hypothetical protein
MLSVIRWFNHTWSPDVPSCLFSDYRTDHTFLLTPV